MKATHEGVQADINHLAAREGVESLRSAGLPARSLRRWLFDAAVAVSGDPRPIGAPRLAAVLLLSWVVLAFDSSGEFDAVRARKG
jgi:hypothetical protein